MLGVPPPLIPLSVDNMNKVSSNSSTPYMSAASSPQCSRPRHGVNFFYSAPASPRSHASCSLFDDVYDDYGSDYVALLSQSSCDFAAMPIDWELKPGEAKVSNGLDDLHRDQTTVTAQYGLTEKEEVARKDKKEEDFQFDFSGQLDMMVEPSLSSADELFDGGIIRPMKLKSPPSHSPTPPKSPKSTISKVKDALNMSPKHRRNMSDFGPDHDSSEPAILHMRKSHPHSQNECEWRGDFNDEVENRERGRCRVKPLRNANTNMKVNKQGGNNSNSRKGMSRSLSPLRVSEFALLQHQAQQTPNEPGNSTRLFGRGSSSNAYSKKWKLKDLLLFRSASEGHYKATQSYSKRWSFRSSNTVSGPGSSSGSGSESGSVSKQRRQVSTHETIYTKNKTVAEELKKKTMLPYRHGLLACLGFSPVLPQFSYAFPNTQ